MTFAKRPDNDLERPYRSNLLDLSVFSDEQLRRRRLTGLIGAPLFVLMFLAGCVGLASNPRTIGALTLVAGAAVLGAIMTVMLIGGILRIRKELATRRWARDLEARDHPEDPHRPWDD